MQNEESKTTCVTAALKEICRRNLLMGIGIASVFLWVFASSCATHQNQSAAVNPGANRTGRAPHDNRVKNIEQRILQEYHRWKGIRHRLGGTGSKGIDCSGFVQAVYWDAFHISLPRTTKAQVHRGKSVSYHELQPGDLVFFKPPDYPRHVGIFLGQSQFVHASKSAGVTISRIDAHYWGKYYWTARRIIPTTQSP